METTITNQAKPVFFESEHVIAGRQIINVTPDDIKAVMDDAKSGRISVTNDIFGLLARDLSGFSVYFHPIYHSLQPDGPRLPWIKVRGENKNNLLSTNGDTTFLDWELKTANTPFDNIEDLLGYLGLPGWLQMGDSSSLEIVAGCPAVLLDTSLIEKGKALIKCQVSSAIDVNKIKVGYKIFHKDAIERSSLLGDQITWTSDGDFKSGSCAIAVKDAPVVQTFLSYDGIALHQGWIADPEKHLNPRHAIHQAFDAELKLIKAFLSEKKESRNFETGVSMLLNILGFSVSHYGQTPKIQEGPDIIVTTPIGHVGVIECTTRHLTENNKLAKLVQRTKLIKDKLDVAGYGYLQVQPIIVSAMTREDVKAELEEAEKHSISVLCRENLDNLLNQVGLPPSPDRLFEEARSFYTEF